PTLFRSDLLKPVPGPCRHDIPGAFHEPGAGQLRLDLPLGRAVEDRRNGPETETACRPTKMGLQHLANVHTAGHAQRAENNVDRGPVGQERHVFHRHNLGDNALIAVAPGHLVAFLQLAPLGNTDPDHGFHARRQVTIVLAVEDPSVHDLAARAVWQAQAGVLDFARLVAKDGPQQLLFRGQLFLALGRDLTHENVVFLHVGADADDPALVQILQRVFADVRNVVGYFFWTQLGIACFQLVLLNVYRGEDVLAHQPLANENGVLKVAAFPGEEGHDNVLAQGQLAELRRGAVGQNIVLADALALDDD